MTQFLIEEAAFAVLDVWEAKASQEDTNGHKLLERHAELTALRDQMRGVK